MYRRQRSKPYSRRKKCKKEKWLSEETLHTAGKKEREREREKLKAKEKRYIHLNAKFQRIARRD